MDATYFAGELGTALSVVRKWEAEQARGASLLAAAQEFHERLLLLGRDAEPALLGVLAEVPDAAARLRAKHVRGLENIAAGMHEALNRFESLHRELAELHAALWKRHGLVAQQRQGQQQSQRQPQKRQPTAAPEPALHEPAWGVVGAGRGLEAQRVLMPPALTCIELVGEVEAAIGHELLTKLQLIEAVEFGEANGSGLHAVARAWSLQPHLSACSAVERLRNLVESLTL